MVSISNIKGSNGSGQAVRGAVTNARTIGSTTLKVDSVTNYPSQFIATTGKLGPSGILDNTTVQVFFGHLSGADIIIDSFAPGYVDKGNSVADVVILKPTTAWADEVAGVLGVAHNDNGTIKNNAVKTSMLDAANIDASVALKDASVTSQKIDFTTNGKVWWEELGRTTLSSAGKTISITGLPARKYLRLQFHLLNTGTVVGKFRFNNDSSANYTLRYQLNGTFGSAVSQTAVGDISVSAGASGYVDIVNVSSSVKTGKLIGIFDGSAAGTAPSLVELWFSWVNTSDQINRIDLVNLDTGDFTAGSELVILGHD